MSRELGETLDEKIKTGEITQAECCLCQMPVSYRYFFSGMGGYMDYCAKCMAKVLEEEK